MSGGLGGGWFVHRPHRVFWRYLLDVICAIECVPQVLHRPERAQTPLKPAMEDLDFGLIIANGPWKPFEHCRTPIASMSAQLIDCVLLSAGAFVDYHVHDSTSAVPGCLIKMGV